MTSIKLKKGLPNHFHLRVYYYHLILNFPLNFKTNINSRANLERIFYFSLRHLLNQFLYPYHCKFYLNNQSNFTLSYRLSNSTRHLNYYL